MVTRTDSGINSSNNNNRLFNNSSNNQHNQHNNRQRDSNNNNNHNKRHNSKFNNKSLLCQAYQIIVNRSVLCFVDLDSFISSPGPKVQVNYCHHLASVVCKLFTFQASSPKPLGRLEPNLAGMFLGWSSTKLLFFVPVGYSIWLPGPIICSDWLKFQRSSSPKLMN